MTVLPMLRVPLPGLTYTPPPPLAAPDEFSVIVQFRIEPVAVLPDVLVKNTPPPRLVAVLPSIVEFVMESNFPLTPWYQMPPPLVPPLTWLPLMVLLSMD